MKRYILSGALIIGLSGLTAVAQTSTTPGTPSSSDPQYQTPAPDNQQYPSDRDSSTDQQQRRDQGTYNTDQDRRDQSNSDIHRDRDSDRDRMPQSDQGYPQQQTDSDRQNNNDQTDRDRQDRYNDQSNRSYNDRDRDRRGMSGDYQNQIQSALSQSNLNNVMVNDNNSRIELTGTVNNGRERRQAIDIAQQYANGRRVVDHIKVRGQGNDQDDHDRDRQDH